MKIYIYAKCSTCRNALKWLDSKGFTYQSIAIRETPPPTKELEAMLSFYNGDIRKLFNTSGMDYRALKLRDRLPNMSQSEALELLASNGSLVKRPFLLNAEMGLVGFREAIWEETLSS